MRELFTIDAKDYDPNGVAYVRPSVRAVVRIGERIALVHSRRDGYYKFPGGGIERGETHEDALIREVAEETGLLVIRDTICPYGLVHRVSKGDSEDIFIQDNYYYLCEVEAERVPCDRDEYEEEAGFELNLVGAAYAREVDLNYPKDGKNPVMVAREAEVLACLMREGIVPASEEGPL